MLSRATISSYNQIMSFQENSLTGAKLFLRSLMPSGFELITTFLSALLLIAIQILALSVSGQAYPVALNDVLLENYTNYIVDPLTATFYSDTFGLITLGLVWGIIGFLVYEGLAFTALQIHEWRVMRSSITIPNERIVRTHPLQKYFVVHMAWRIFIIFLTLVLTILLLPVMRICLTNIESMLEAKSIGQLAWLIGIDTLLWVLVIHCYIILLRWYLFRTRLTGEILY